MTKLCYYISDHGWGHAARSIAIIRELLAQTKDIQIIVKADYPLQFMKDSLLSIPMIKETYVGNGLCAIPFRLGTKPQPYYARLFH